MNQLKQLSSEVGRVIVGYEDLIEKVIFSIIADRHIIIESPPGLGKTLLIKTLQQCVGGAVSRRIQFHSRLRPEHILGAQVFNPVTGQLNIVPGAVQDCHILLVDEANRAPEDTQTALLGPMEEREVIVGGQHFGLFDPFLVMATVNPLKQQGTYPIPEANYDRFGMKLKLGYLSEEEELRILSNPDLEERDPYKKLVRQVITVDELVSLRERIKHEVLVSDEVRRYIIALAQATRPGTRRFREVEKKLAEACRLAELISAGCGPRAESALQRLSRVRAFFQGRDHVLPDDVAAIAHDVMRHRIQLSHDAKLDGISEDDLISMILSVTDVLTVPLPEDSDA